MSILVVSGTGTGVGKTVVTAAIAALAADRGARVAVVKPAQTGAEINQSADVDVVRHLTGLTDVHEWSRYPLPLAPAAAARHSGMPPPDLDAMAERIKALTDEHRLVLVEGAGGLLVRYDEDGTTIAHLAAALDAPVLVVCDPRLGTLNHTALTLEALAHRGLRCEGVVIGAWPQVPDLTARSNIRDLETLAARPLVGALAADAGDQSPSQFLAIARAGLGPGLGGAFDAADFRRTWAPTNGAPRDHHGT